VLSPRLAKSSSTRDSSSEEHMPSFVVASSPVFTLASSMMSLTSTEMIALALPVVPSMILVVLEVAQSSPKMIDACLI
jgi:hypothetical protein